MKYSYYTCDVFTDTRFGGNPLAVVVDAVGLSDVQMQRVAREFNYSETTFVLPPEHGQTRRVRIFTPVEELPFAGHPNIGTAFVLGATGGSDASRVVFEEPAGLVGIDMVRESGRVVSCELKAPQALTLGKTAAPADVAHALSLDEADIVTGTHSPITASVGLGFLMVELADRDALARAGINMA
ncbi:MAG TPA: PhzF family phenazine biosynthesis protein, partial [Pseudomonadales bacterium]|nr:PhzF family phenazine biosynthesis protein [Pseudomonadales bacterium]